MSLTIVALAGINIILLTVVILHVLEFKMLLAIFSSRGELHSVSVRWRSRSFRRLFSLIEAYMRRISSHNSSAAADEICHPPLAFLSVSSLEESAQLLLSNLMEHLRADGVALICRDDSGALKAGHMLRMTARGGRFDKFLARFFESYFTTGDKSAIGWIEHPPGDLSLGFACYDIDTSLSVELEHSKSIFWAGFFQPFPNRVAREKAQHQIETACRTFDNSMHLWNLYARTVAMQSVSEECSKFMAYAAHDMRSPLQTIKLILENASVVGSPGFCGELSDAIHMCDLLAELVENTLDYSLVKAGVINAKPQEFDCEAAVSSVCRVMEPLARRKRLTLIRDIPSSLILRANQRQFERMLTNVVANAIKFSSQGGVTIAARQNRHDTITITVKDTGRGIRGDTDRIFEPFVRGDQDPESGYGIGLALVKVFAEMNDCRIAVDSEPGKGTIVVLHVPSGRANNIPALLTRAG